MQNSYAPASLRRSSRVPVNVPILVTSLEPGARFSEVCETLEVNAHGCSMRSQVKLDAGVVVHFHSKEGRETTAKVVYCQPLDSAREGWRLGARPGSAGDLLGFEDVSAGLGATARAGGADRGNASRNGDGEECSDHQPAGGEVSGLTEIDAGQSAEASG